MTLIPNKWVSEFLGETDGGIDDEWALCVEHDCMMVGHPFVVTIVSETREAGKKEETLIAMNPDKAREVAAALLLYAHFAERENELRAEARQ